MHDIIPILSLIAFPFLVALAAWSYQMALQKLPGQQRQALEQFACLAVGRVEQVYGAMGPLDKKRAAVASVEKLFTEFGLPVPSSSAIDAAIEATVLALTLAQTAHPTTIPTPMTQAPQQSAQDDQHLTTQAVTAVSLDASEPAGRFSQLVLQHLQAQHGSIPSIHNDEHEGIQK